MTRVCPCPCASTGTGAPHTSSAAQAASVLERLVKTDENNLEALRTVARIRSALGEKQKALDALRASFFISPFDYKLHAQAGELSVDLKDHAQALTEFQVALALQPPNIAEANYNVAAAYHALGRQHGLQRADREHRAGGQRSRLRGQEPDRERLLAALTPLYFGRTAGFISDTLDMTTDQAERVIDDQARQFEELKPYLVSRWNEMRSATGGSANAFEALTKDGVSSLTPEQRDEITRYHDQLLRELVAADSGRPTTFGWGPRFLHSTGQFHKGGPATGVYLQVTGPGSDIAKRTRIHHNYFYNHQFSGANGGESIRLGYSHKQSKSAYAVSAPAAQAQQGQGGGQQGACPASRV